MRKHFIQSDTKVFPANYLLLLEHFLESHEYDIKTIRQKIQIPPQALENPECFVSYGFLKEYLETVLEVTQKPELGLYFGRELNFTAHGDMGNAIIASKNSAESLNMILKYFKTRTPLAEVNFSVQESDAIIQANFKLLPEAIEGFLIDALFASIFTISKFILANTHLDLKIYYTRPKPDNIKPYHEFFGENVYFSAQSNEYHFPKERLAINFQLSNPIARKIAERKCQQKLKELETLDDLISKSKALLLSTPGYFPTIEELSDKLHMSVRTLRRRFKELDTSYQEVLDELRKELAINYLQNTELSILEIAQLLEFSDSSNFSSAFRKWTNKSPREFRSV